MSLVRCCLALLLLQTGCSSQTYNFSQYPGFAEWYAANPPSSSLPAPDQKALLERYKPRIFLPDSHEGPIDFYLDYIAHGRLEDNNGQLISNALDQTELNRHKTDPDVVFSHHRPEKTPDAKIYGRITEERVDWPSCNAPQMLTFLTYHLVFRSSGLPAGVPGWQAAGLGVIADLDDWHQLDHYTAMTLTLSPGQPEALRPIAVTFQQHNYQRSYLLSENSGPDRLAMPADGRLSIDVAIRSNELYPHEPDRTSRRAVSFLDPKGAAYMVADGPAPWLAANDITDPANEIDPPLDFLPPDDAFYIFQGWLGERRRLPGREGPPGADYNTLPSMKPFSHQMALFWWHQGDREWLSLYQDLSKDGPPAEIDPAPFLTRIADVIDLGC